MPELPEVETIRRGLMKRILRKRIRRVEIRASKVVKNDPKEFITALMGNSFTKIDRRGKLLILHLQPSPRLRPASRGVSREKQFLLVHLKMTGQLIYESEKTVVGGGHSWPPIKNGWPNAYTRVIFSFTDGSRLFFNDLRKFGVMKVVDKATKDLVVASYGVEPLDPVNPVKHFVPRGNGASFTWERFQTALGKRQAPLKAVLLNQALIAGLGNIYVDEVAWHAKVRPGRRVNTLTLAERKKIFRVIPRVLKEAIAWGGTTFQHFRDSEGEKGNYVDRLKAYGRGGKPCPRCKTILRKTTVAQRGTVYCPVCQR